MSNILRALLGRVLFKTRYLTKVTIRNSGVRNSDQYTLEK